MAKNRRRQKNSGNGLLMVVIIVAAVLVSASTILGGMAESSIHTQVYPMIPAPAPEQLNIVPSVQTFSLPAPTAIVYEPVVVHSGSKDVVVPFVAQGCTVPEGWRVGVSPLPDCWGSMTLEDQNAIIRNR